MTHNTRTEDEEVQHIEGCRCLACTLFPNDEDLAETAARYNAYEPSVIREESCPSGMRVCERVAGDGDETYPGTIVVVSLAAAETSSPALAAEEIGLAA